MEKYDYIEEVIQECLFNKDVKAATTDKADRIMTHPVWGIPVFLGIMALVFFLTLRWEISSKDTLRPGWTCYPGRPLHFSPISMRPSGSLP